MKKHLLGLAIFSFIFASFAVLFAFLYAPKIPNIPQVEEIRRPVFESDRKYSCNKRSNIVEFEVISVNYDLDERKLYAQIKMKFGYNSQLPQSISVGGSVSTENKIGAKEIGINRVVVDKSEFTLNSNEAIFTIVTEFNTREIKQSDNLYANFNFIQNYENNSRNGKLYLSDPKPILFVHGTDSIVKK